MFADFLSSVPSFFDFQTTNTQEQIAHGRKIEKDFSAIRERISKIGQREIPLEKKIEQDLNRIWNESLVQLSQEDDRFFYESEKAKISN